MCVVLTDGGTPTLQQSIALLFSVVFIACSTNLTISLLPNLQVNLSQHNLFLTLDFTAKLIWAELKITNCSCMSRLGSFVKSMALVS